MELDTKSIKYIHDFLNVYESKLGKNIGQFRLHSSYECGNIRMEYFPFCGILSFYNNQKNMDEIPEIRIYLSHSSDNWCYDINDKETYRSMNAYNTYINFKSYSHITLTNSSTEVGISTFPYINTDSTEQEFELLLSANDKLIELYEYNKFINTLEPGDIIINYIYTNDNDLSKVCKYLDMFKRHLD